MYTVEAFTGSMPVLSLKKKAGSEQQADFETTLHNKQSGQEFMDVEGFSQNKIIEKSGTEGPVNKLMPLLQEETGPMMLQQMLKITEQASLEKKMIDIETQAKEMLSKINDETGASQAASQLLNLLEEWTHIQSQMSDTVDRQTEALEMNGKLRAIIQELQPNHLNGNHMTERDIVLVMDWLVSTEKSGVLQSSLPLLKRFADDLKLMRNESQGTQAFQRELNTLLTRLTDILYEKSDVQNLRPPLVENNQETKESYLWRDLLSLYQKRKGFESTYRTNATVESKDVSRWITHALKKHTGQQNTIAQAGASMPTMPLSKLEQYVIHVNQSPGAPPVDEQIMEQFQKIVQLSRFSVHQDGKMQLSMILRPENLGEITVRLVQIDGEMTVKMIVSSMQAKEMLEKNIHQLRNVFAPHQVTIERQELNLQSANELQQEQKDEDSQEQQHEQQNDHEEKQDKDNKFEAYFQELLLNEKV